MYWVKEKHTRNAANDTAKMVPCFELKLELWSSLMLGVSTVCATYLQLQTSDNSRLKLILYMKHRGWLADEDSVDVGARRVMPAYESTDHFDIPDNSKVAFNHEL